MFEIRPYAIPRKDRNANGHLLAGVFTFRFNKRDVRDLVCGEAGGDAVKTFFISNGEDDHSSSRRKDRRTRDRGRFVCGMSDHGHTDTVCQILPDNDVMVKGIGS